MTGTRKKRKLNTSAEETNKEESLYHNVYYPSLKVHCDFCDKDVTRHTRIVSVEAPDSDICINCFIEDDDSTRQVHDNPYHVINRLNFPLYEENWTGEEELLLLEGLEKFGFGNWIDIAEHLATDKQPEDVMNHYEKIYVSSKDFLPPSDILSKRDAKHNLVIKSSTAKSNKITDEMDSKRKKYTKQYESKKEKEKENANTLSTTTAVATSAQNVGGLSATKDSTTSASEVVGYMPLRGDFDYEYDNEAELFLAEMEFNDEDKPEEVAIKMKILEVYNMRLDERIKRKNFVIERDLLDLKKQSMLDRTRTKDEKEIYNMMKIFARFNTPEDHEKLVQGIYKEKMLKRRIEELRFYKKIGLKTFEEVELYLADKKKKEEALQKKQKQNDFVYENKIKSSAARRIRYSARDGGESRESIEKKNKFALTQLNEKEVSLCDHVGISPHEFLLIKDLLVRECLKEGHLSRNFIDMSIKLDFKEKANEVFDYLVSNKVISEKS